MSQQAWIGWKLKAEAFDRLVEKYQSLEKCDGFYSQNWLEFTELFEQELQKLKSTLLLEEETTKKT